MQNRWVRFTRLLITLLIPVSVIGGVVRLVSTERFLAFEYGRDSFPPDSYGLTRQQRFEFASTDIHYVLAHLAADTLANQKLDGAPAYSEREVSHMADVRAVFQGVFRAWQAALILSLLLGSVLWSWRERHVLASAIGTGGLVTSALVLSIALLAFFGWQIWFNLFHSLFFKDGSWLFDYSDMLIRLFPLNFWSDATFTISLMSLASGIFTALAGWSWLAALNRTPREIDL